MMRNILGIRWTGFLLGICMLTSAIAKNIQAFGLWDRAFIQTQGAKVCYLDHGKSIAHINQTLQSGTHLSEQAILNRYRKDFEAISRRTVCKAQAARVGIKKLPAVVFDGKYVVYGEINIERAAIAVRHFINRSI